VTPTEQGPVLSRAPYAILAVAGVLIATVFAAVAALAAKPATQATPGPVRPGPVATGSTTSATPRSAAPAPVATSTEIVMSTTTPKPTTTSTTRPTTTTPAANPPAPQPPAPQPPAPAPPQPKPPVASFSFICTGEVLRCTFDAGNSHDPDGRIIYYAWAFGDGTGDDGPGKSKTAHDYREPGTYTVTMAVMDNSGMTDTTERQVRVG
jgi:PKD repeat protein